MLTLDPDNRLDMNGVMNHPWMLASMPIHEEVVQEFDFRHKTIRLAEKEEHKNDSAISGGSSKSKKANMRSANDDEDEEEPWDSADL